MKNITTNLKCIFFLLFFFFSKQNKQILFYFLFYAAMLNRLGDQPRRAQKNVDSYQRLFGEPERAMTPAKNHMRSNIPFGAKNEAAQTLINGNGNGNGHHYNGKSGSVSSASSSVSSSTENLKMNGYSKTGEQN